MGRYRKIYVVWLCGFYLMTATIYAMLGIGMLYSYIVYGRARILLIGDVYSEHFVEIPVFLLASITSIHQLIKPNEKPGHSVQRLAKAYKPICRVAS